MMRRVVVSAAWPKGLKKENRARILSFSIMTNYWCEKDIPYFGPINGKKKTSRWSFVYITSGERKKSKTRIHTESIPLFTPVRCLCDLRSLESAPHCELGYEYLCFPVRLFPFHPHERTGIGAPSHKHTPRAPPRAVVALCLSVLPESPPFPVFFPLHRPKIIFFKCHFRLDPIKKAVVGLAFFGTFLVPR